MKKVFVILFLFLIFASQAFALDFIVGAKGGYFIWRPYFKDIDDPWMSTVEKGDGILYGPVASVIFTDNLSFSIAGLYGKQSAHWKTEDYYWEMYNFYFSGTNYVDMTRIDIDSAISYRIFQNVKIILGYKYQSVTNVIQSYGRIQEGAVLNKYTIDQRIDIDIYAHGPALGLGLSIPFAEVFFISANLSALYMKGNFKVDLEADLYVPEFNMVSPGPINGTVFDDSTEHVGLNFEPAIGAMIGKHVMVTLGGRYQYLRTEIDTDFEQAKGKMDDYLYGAFVSVLFVL